MEKILIIQNGNMGVPISKYLDILKIPYVVLKSFEYGFKQKLVDINPENYKMLIILGGHQYVTEIHNYPILENIISLIKCWMNSKKPILGVCLGMHLIAHTIGCKIETGEQKLDYSSYCLGYKGIFRCHRDYVVPDDKIEVLEWQDNMPYFIKVKNANIIAIQCHPDIPPEQVSEYINNSAIKEHAGKYGEEIDVQNMAIIRKLIDLFD